jgi:dCMP deaminase
MKEKFKRAYMETAQTFAKLSSARRLKVGAIVVKDDRIISIGYNGMPAGWDNNCEDEIFETVTEDTGKATITTTRKVLKTKPEVLHAESNAIAKLAKSGESGLGATIFITHSPCLECAKLIYQSGINKIYYGSDYRDSTGLKFLESSGVGIEQMHLQDSQLARSTLLK